MTVLKSNLTPIQRLILLAADKQGHVPMEQPETAHCARLFNDLVVLHGGGFVMLKRERVSLTHSGKVEKSRLLKEMMRTGTIRRKKMFQGGVE